MNIPLPVFEPDKAFIDSAASAWMLNVQPVADGWAPIPKLKEISDALGADCKGAFACQREDGTWIYIAGTAAKLYTLDTSDNSWDDATRLSGGDYAVGLNEQWVFRKFGPYVVAVNGTDDMQKINIESDTEFSAVGGSPPVAYGIEVIGDFLVAYNISGEPGRLQWCEINDIEGWDLGENLSDYNDLPDLGAIQFIVPSASGGIVCCELGFWSMNFALSSQWVFTFSLIHKVRGVAPRYAVVPIGPGDFIYYSYEGFFRGDTPIGAERVNKWFKSYSDDTDIINMQGALDPEKQIVWFRFKAKDGDYYLLGYNYLLDRWCLSTNQFQAMLRLGNPVITIDGMDNYFATIDDIDVPYDSTFWAGGVPSFGGITPNQKLAYQSGAANKATLETAQLSLNGVNRATVNGGRAITDAVNFTANVGVVDYHGQSMTWKTAVTPSARTKFIPFRADGRLHKFRVIVAEGEGWTFIGSLDVDAIGTGMS